MDNNEFDEYYEGYVLKQVRLFNNYLGIKRKDFPKWQGWKIINKYKANGSAIDKIEDSYLNMHVRNFHYLRHIKSEFYINPS